MRHLYTLSSSVEEEKYFVSSVELLACLELLKQLLLKEVSRHFFYYSENMNVYFIQRCVFLEPKKD